MNIKFVYCLLLATCVMSCSQNKRNATIVPAEASIVAETVDSITEWPKEHTMSNECFISTETDSVVILPLRESESHMLGQIAQVASHNDTLVIADARQVCLFDEQGCYLATIGAMGHGPNEYIDFGGMYMSEDSIYIKDKGTGCILTYDFKGRLTNKRSFPDGAPQSFCVLGNGVVLGGFSGYRPNAVYRLVIYNAGNAVAGTAFPYTEPHEYVAGNFVNVSQTEAMFTYPLCDIIYKVSENRITPAIRMNIQNEKAVTDFISATSSLPQDKFIKALLSTDNIVNHVKVYPCKNNGWFVYYQDSKGSYFSFIDNKGRRDYIRVNKDQRELYYPFIVVSLCDNWLYAYVEAAAFSFMDEDSKNKWLNYIAEHSIRTVTTEDIENGLPLLFKMHIRE